MPLEEYRNIALAARPDLKAAMQSLDLAKINHRLAIANGSTDPIFSGWWTENPSFNNPFANNTIGASFSIPLRIFDRNQGEKLRTQIDIGRNERLRDATQAGVFSDVDSAYWTLVQQLNLLKPYTLPFRSSIQIDVNIRNSCTWISVPASLVPAREVFYPQEIARIYVAGSVGPAGPLPAPPSPQPNCPS